MMEVKLTEKAASEVKRIIDEKKLPETSALRVAVAAGGCSGFEYRLEFEENPDEQQDFVKEIHGVRVTVDRKSAEILGGTEIDFKEDLMSRSFVFNNPLAVRTCGCGNSFQ
jgi:iron-sulfur cluster assembly protein